MLFERSFEIAECPGLGLIPGDVIKMEKPGLKIPHMGWNSIVKTNPCRILEGVPEGAHFYFVHSYRAVPLPENLAAYTDYDDKTAAVVQNGFVYGTQFHPEKSGDIGMRILKNFWELVK
jgi:glutamine amidotransferase